MAAPEHRALVRSVLTATRDQFASVLPDFQYLVWTLRTDLPGPWAARVHRGDVS
jgi:hypothetical protein